MLINIDSTLIAQAAQVISSTGNVWRVSLGVVADFVWAVMGSVVIIVLSIYMTKVATRAARFVIQLPRPLVFFNGDRLTFVKQYEIEKTTEQKKTSGQQLDLVEMIEEIKAEKAQATA